MFNAAMMVCNLINFEVSHLDENGCVKLFYQTPFSLEETCLAEEDTLRESLRVFLLEQGETEAVISEYTCEQSN